MKRRDRAAGYPPRPTPSSPDVSTAGRPRGRTAAHPAGDGRFSAPRLAWARRFLALILALFLPLSFLGCGESKIRDLELSEELSAAFGWEWIKNPTKTAVDMGLLTQDEVENGISLERLIEVRKTIENRKNSELFLHGFYAGGSYGQIELTKEMDSVSFGWAKVAINEENGLFLNQSPGDGNGWYVPEGSQTAIDYMEENHTPYHLSVFGSSGVAKEWIAPENREEAVELLVAAAADYDGLTIDFEGLRGEEMKENFTKFMENLRESLQNEKKLYVCVQPLTWFNGYDYRGLGAICDKVILMAHDYQWLSVPEENLGTDQTETPVAPLNHVYSALRDITDSEIGVENTEKVVLAISFASCGVEIDENGLLCNQSLFTPGTDTLEKRLGQPEAEVVFDEATQSPCVTYQNEEGRWFKVWFENEESVGAKLALARLFGISGLSLWRIGSIPNGENFNVWNSLLQAR